MNEQQLNKKETKKLLNKHTTNTKARGHTKFPCIKHDKKKIIKEEREHMNGL